jgi:hypothetical protein
MVFSLLLMGCGSNPQLMTMSKHNQWEYMLPGEDYIVVATGYAPIQTQIGADDPTKIIKAIKASKLDAYRELTEKVYGHKVSANTKVSDLVLGNEKIKTSVQGVIKGARTIKTYQLDGIYITELELNLRDLYRIRAFTNGQTKLIKATTL